jgi:hypothetical protein
VITDKVHDNKMYYRPNKVDYEGLKFLIMSALVDSIMKQTIKVRKNPSRVSLMIMNRT